MLDCKDSSVLLLKLVHCCFVFHLLMLRVQYASWSVCHGLLGTQEARNGS